MIYTKPNVLYIVFPAYVEYNLDDGKIHVINEEYKLDKELNEGTKADLNFREFLKRHGGRAKIDIQVWYDKGTKRIHIADNKHDLHTSLPKDTEADTILRDLLWEHGKEIGE